MIKFIPLGRSDNYGVNCYYLNLFGTGIILDSGMHPRILSNEGLPSFEVLENFDIDYVLISHAHQDHIGSLPFLIKKFPYLKVITTPQTKDIAELTLHNAANILENSIIDKDLKPYSHDELELFLGTIIIKEYQNTFTIRGLRHIGDDIRVTFYDAGHILGSAGILLEHRNNRIFYSGDIKTSPQFLLPGADLPNKPVDTLILEATYGSTETDQIGERDDEIKRFVKSANKILEQGGSVLCPVFALGKTQELLGVLEEEMQKGRLIKTRIYTGGLGRDISRLYDNHRYLVKRVDKNFVLKNIRQIDFYKLNDFDEFIKYPGIVLASSGMMLRNTNSYNMAKYWFGKEKFGIFSVGYMDPETPGFNVANAQKGDCINLGNDEKIEIKCEIENFRFSAHSNRNELLGIIDHLKPSRIVLIHGDEDAVSWMGYNIMNKMPNIKVHVAEALKEINIL